MTVIHSHSWYQWIGFVGKILTGNHGFYMFLPCEISGFLVSIFPSSNSLMITPRCTTIWPNCSLREFCWKIIWNNPTKKQLLDFHCRPRDDEPLASCQLLMACPRWSTHYKVINIYVGVSIGGIPKMDLQSIGTSENNMDDPILGTPPI